MRRFIPGRKTCLAVFGLLVVAAALGYWQRDRLLAWHAVRQLAQADEADRDSCVERVIELGSSCVAGLLNGLDDASTGPNMTAGLAGLIASWGVKDERTHELAVQLAEHYGRCGVEGRKQSLYVAQTLARTGNAASLPAALTRPLTDIITKASADAEVRCAALNLARAYFPRMPSEQAASLGHKLVESGLDDQDADTRLAAAQVARGPWFRDDQELLAKVVPLLKDDMAALRIEALKALAERRELADDDDLLHLLHDPEPEVQYVCELALRSRGLSDDHIAMARLISDDRPAARLQVLDRLHRALDLDPGVWVQRLSEDVSPAVRAGAVRAAATLPQLDMGARLSAMAKSDPSPTVRQLAQYYLRRAGARER